MTSKNGTGPNPQHPQCQRCASDRVVRAYRQALADSIAQRRPVGIFIYISPGAPVKLFRTVPAGLIAQEIDGSE